MKTNNSTSKARFEKVEPGLFRYKASVAYYTILKKDGKTKWKNLQTTGKATARRLQASGRNEQKETGSNLAGLKLGTLTDKYLASIANLSNETPDTRHPIITRLHEQFPRSTKVRESEASDLSVWIASLTIANLHPDLITAIGRTQPVQRDGLLGTLESFNVATMIKAADAAGRSVIAEACVLVNAVVIARPHPDVYREVV